MAQHVSPGVYTKIIDLSEFVQNVPSTIGYIPIISERGRDNQLIFTNARDFYLDYGKPNITYAGSQYGQGPYVASSFLRQSDALYVMRVLPLNQNGVEDATYSNLILRCEQTGYLGADGTSTVYATSATDLVRETSVTSEFASEAEETGEDTCVIFYGVGRGEWYDNFKVDITPIANETERAEKPDVYILDFYQKQSTPDETDGTDRYEIIDTFTVSFDNTRMDDSGDSMFIEDIVNRHCRYIQCKADANVCKQAINNGAEFDLPFTDGALELENGSSGGLFDATTGVIDSGVATACLSLAYLGELENVLLGAGNLVTDVIDTEDHYFNLVFDAGYPTSVKTSIKTLCHDLRQDCLGIIDNSDSATYSEAYDNRSDSGGATYSLNSRYLAIYEPYSKIYDVYTGRDIWITPVYHMANIIPYTDNVTELWYAPAGFNRATIAGIKELRFSPNLAQRDQLYLKQINPIVKFNVGYTVYGQLTAQVRPTALQDVNIMRLVLYIKRALEQFCRFYIFEMNDSGTWGAITDQVNKFLKTIQDKRGLYSYSVNVGASEYDIKAKRLNVNVTLNPTRVVEQILLNMYIV